MKACPQTRPEYLDIAAVNWSTLKYAVQSGLHYQHGLTHAKEETDAMRLGRATHTAVFEPDRLLREYVIWEGGRRQGKDWDEFQQMHAGKTILKPEDYDTSIAIRDAVRAHSVAKKLLRAGQAECTITWVDDETGLPCKCRVDWLTGKYLVDLKTTRSIDARAFGRHAADMLWHCQMAFASMGLRANKQQRAVKLVAVEQEPPHDVAVFTVTDDMLWVGEEKVYAALALVAECRKAKKWPGRYPSELPLELPAWEFPKEDMDLADLGLVPRKVATG